MNEKLKAYLGLIPYSGRISFGDEDDKDKGKSDPPKDPPEPPKPPEKKDDKKSQTIDLNINVEIPKIDKNKTYTVEEIEKLVSDSVKAGATVTKNQLHDEINKLRDKITETEGRLKSSPENNKLTEENIELKTKLKILEDEVTKVVIRSESLEQTLAQEKLDVHKAKLIAEAKGRIVEEVLVGKTIEELNAAATIAKQKYEEYSEKVRKEFNLPKVEQPKPGSEVQPAGEIAVTRIDPKDPASIKEWEKKKKEVTDTIWSQYIK